jgi:hypothetical protein
MRYHKKFLVNAHCKSYQPSRYISSVPCSSYSSYSSLFWNLTILPPSSIAKRESPFPIIFLGGINYSSNVFAKDSNIGISKVLQNQGYTIGLVDISSKQLSPLVITLDDIINDLHTLLSTRLSTSPITIASHHTAVLKQKYLESWPLTALVMLDPFSPKKPSRNHLLNNLQITNYEPNSIELINMLASDPVRLEPSPVPIKAFFSMLNESNSLITTADVIDTQELHQLELEDCIITNCKSPLDIKIEKLIIEFITRRF